MSETPDGGGPSGDPRTRGDVEKADVVDGECGGGAGTPKVVGWEGSGTPKMGRGGQRQGLLELTGLEGVSDP